MSWRDRAKPVETKPQTGWRARAKAVEEEVVPHQYKTLQEQHPSVTAGMRATLKNFSNSPESGLGYLKQNLPGHDVEYDDRAGQYKIKKLGDDAYRVVDPDTGFFSTDFASDLGDIAYDIPAGIAEGVGAAVGGVTGTALGPAGTIGGAMTGGAITGGALEETRQQIGRALGIPQEMDQSQANVNAAFGAAGPLMFGVNKTPGLAQGAYRVARNKIAPTIGAAASGVDKGAIKYIMQSADNLDAVNNTTAPQILDDVATFQQGMKKTLANERASVGQELGSAIDEIGGVDLSSVTNTILDEVKKREEIFNRTGNQADFNAWKRAQQAYDDVIGETGSFEGQDIMRLKDRIKGEAKAYKAGSPSLVSRHGDSMASEDKALADKFMEAYQNLNDTTDNLTAGRTGELNTQYGQVANDQKYLNKLFKDEETTFRTLSNMNGRAKKIQQAKIADIDGRYDDLNIGDKVDFYNAYKYFGDDAGLTPLSSGGTTSTSRTVPLAVLGGSLGSLIGYNTGLGYAGAALGGGAGAFLGSKIGSPGAIKAGVKLLHGLEGAGRLTREAIADIATKAGVPEDTLVREAMRQGVQIQGAQALSPWEGM